MNLLWWILDWIFSTKCNHCGTKLGLVDTHRNPHQPSIILCPTCYHKAIHDGRFRPHDSDYVDRRPWEDETELIDVQWLKDHSSVVNKDDMI